MTFIHHQPKQTSIDQFARHVSSGKVDFFQSVAIDFVLGKRDGPYLWDVADSAGEKPIIDCHCNGGVFNLGHRHPAIVAALRNSLDELDIGNHHLLSEQRARLAARLAELMPGDITYTVFGVGGGEAMDVAIKVARGFTGRQQIISANGGYHGHTGFSLMTGDDKYYAPFGQPLPGFLQVPFGDIDALATAVTTTPTAAIIFETIPATLGMPIPPPNFYAQVRDLCDQHAVLLVMDEIQTGFGRTGKLWGFEHYDIVPDMVTLGKGMSGGLYPLSATCLRTDLERVFHEDPFIHISTFGGAEIGCPVALKVLEISSDPAFLANVNEMAAFFADESADLQTRHPALVQLRQLGLMMGLELVSEYAGPFFTKAAYEVGLLSVYANNDTRVSQLLPPLITERPLAEEILVRVDEALSMVETALGLD